VVLGEGAEDGDEEEVEEQLDVACVFALVVPQVRCIGMLHQVAEDWQIFLLAAMKDLGALGDRLRSLGGLYIPIVAFVVRHDVQEKRVWLTGSQEEAKEPRSQEPRGQEAKTLLYGKDRHSCERPQIFHQSLAPSSSVGFTAAGGRHGGAM